jgi:hypothetical protein
MTTTYPKAKHLSLGYNPTEDRLILTAHLQDKRKKGQALDAL